MRRLNAFSLQNTDSAPALRERIAAIRQQERELRAERWEAEALLASTMQHRRAKAHEQAVLDFMRDYYRQNGLPPTMQEIVDAGAMRSKSGVNHVLKKLVAQGLVRHLGKNTARAFLPVMEDS